jgi:hypothetical protein
VIITEDDSLFGGGTGDEHIGMGDMELEKKMDLAGLLNNIL